MTDVSWETTKLKYVADCNTRVLSETTSGDRSFKYVDIGAVGQGSIAIPTELTAFADAPSRARRLAEPGDTIISTVRTYLRAVATVPETDEDLVFSTGFAVLHPRPDVSRRFLAYVLQGDAFVDKVVAHSVGVSYPAITASDLMALDLLLPPPDGQRAIADYLDQETAQIDALVAKQEEFIGLLQERRSGLIAAGVTGRNLGDDVDDSASWIGLPPSGWLLGQVKHFGTVTLGKMLQSSDKGADLLAPYMRAANVQPDGVLDVDDVKSMWFSPRELRMLDLQSGDVVVVEGGIGGYGRAAYVAEHFDGWGFQNSINRIRPFAENDGRYLTYFLLMARQKGFISAYCNIVSMPHLTSEKLEAMPMFLPPPEVQRQIADRLDEQTARIDTLIVKAEEHIALAKERRSALITAAVTGQFDVRTARKAG